MTTTDYLHFIKQYAPRYVREEARIPKDAGKVAEYKEKLLGYLADYNNAATRENKRTYKTVKELLIDHSFASRRE